MYKIETGSSGLLWHRLRFTADHSWCKLMEWRGSIIPTLHITQVWLQITYTRVCIVSIYKGDTCAIRGSWLELKSVGKYPVSRVKSSSFEAEIYPLPVDNPSPFHSSPPTRSIRLQKSEIGPDLIQEGSEWSPKTAEGGGFLLGRPKPGGDSASKEQRAPRVWPGCDLRGTEALQRESEVGTPRALVQRVGDQLNRGWGLGETSPAERRSGISKPAWKRRSGSF